MTVRRGVRVVGEQFGGSDNGPARIWLDGQTNGWGLYFNTPATTGTFYLWSLAQGTGSVTTGALVTSAVTVS